MAKKTKKTKKQKPKANSKRPTMAVERREVTGRKVKNLREGGFLPASIYGREIDSLSVKADLSEIKNIFSRAGETSLVDLKVKGENKKRAVLLKNPQYHPITDRLLHIDFHQVDLTQTVTADVPVELAGKSPAAESGEGVLVQLINELEVEALPTDLPDKFIVDVSGLKKVDDAVTIADLEEYSKNVKISAEKEAILAKVEPLLEEIEEPVVPEEELLAEEKLVEGEPLPEEEKEDVEEEPAESESGGQFPPKAESKGGQADKE